MTSLTKYTEQQTQISTNSKKVTTLRDIYTHKKTKMRNCRTDSMDYFQRKNDINMSKGSKQTSGFDRCGEGNLQSYLSETNMPVFK